MQKTVLMREMIDVCQDIIDNHADPSVELPPSVSSEHLSWMCRRLNKHIEEWSIAKMNRWIGFIQCAMIANRMIDLDGVKAMFDKAKFAFGEPSQELLDHLDPDSAFRFDLGGQG